MKLDKETIKAVFDTHPKTDELFATEDGTLFFKENDAQSYCQSKNYTSKPVLVTRQDMETWNEPATGDTGGKQQEVKTEGADTGTKSGSAASKLTEGEVATASSAADAIARIATLDTAVDIDAYVTGETRVTVIAAADDRKAALAQS